MPMARHTFSDHFAIKHVERRKQSGCAISLVVVRHRAAAALLHRQPRLSAIKSLNLAFLVDAEDQGSLGRIEMQSNDIVELLDKMFVTADLEGLDEMRFEVVLFPNALNTCRTDALRLSHRAYAPVGSGRWLGPQGRLNNGTHFLFGDAWKTPGTRGIFFKPGDPQSQKTFSPELNSWSGDSDFTCDVLVGNPVVRHLDDSCALHQTERKTSSFFPGGQGGPLFG